LRVRVAPSADENVVMLYGPVPMPGLSGLPRASPASSSYFFWWIWAKMANLGSSVASAALNVTVTVEASVAVTSVTVGKLNAWIEVESPVWRAIE
jgi:hypothetical protein